MKKKIKKRNEYTKAFLLIRKKIIFSNKLVCLILFLGLVFFKKIINKEGSNRRFENNPTINPINDIIPNSERPI